MMANLKMGMMTDTFDCLLSKIYHVKRLSAKFLGVFPADKIPLPLTKWPAGFVANTDPEGEPGQHWVAMYQKSPFAQLEYFDSYGYDPSFYDFNLPDSLTFSDRQLQSPGSDVCGNYCVYFLAHRPMSH